MPKVFERITEAAVRIVHPVCGRPVLLITLKIHSRGLSAFGICHACGRYVRMKLDTPKADGGAARRRVSPPSISLDAP